MMLPILLLFQVNATTVLEKPSCARCEVRLTNVATLGRASDPVLIDQWSRVVSGADGTIYVGPSADFGKIILFDSLGRYRTTFGRVGHGPGEFHQPYPIGFSTDGGVVAIDPTQSRLTRLTKAGKVAATIPVEVQTNSSQIVLLKNGNFVLGADVRGAATAGHSIHLMSPKGQRLRSFGDIGPATLADPRSIANPILEDAGDGKVWSAKRARYELQLWDTAGALLRTFRRNADWFVEGEVNPTTRIDEVRPGSRVNDLWLDKDHLWVLVRVADLKWRAARSVSAADLRKERGVVPIAKFDEYLDTVIEVINLRSGDLVASQRLDRYFHSFTNGGLLWAFREHEDGMLSIDLMRMTISQP